MSAPSPPQITPRPDCGNAEITLYFEAPLSEGSAAFDGYNLYESNLGFITFIQPNVGHIYISSLTNGTDYTYYITALNEDSLESDPAYFRTVQLGDPPSAPQEVYSYTYVKGDTTAELRWLPPVSNGGAQIRWYVVTATAPGVPTLEYTFPDAGFFYIISNLDASNLYLFTVYAVNDPGYSPGATYNNSSPEVSGGLIVYYNQSSLYTNIYTWSNAVTALPEFDGYIQSDFPPSTNFYTSNLGGHDALYLTGNGTSVNILDDLSGAVLSNGWQETFEMWVYYQGGGTLLRERGSPWNLFSPWSITLTTIQDSNAFINSVWENIVPQRPYYGGLVQSNTWTHLIWQFQSNADKPYDEMMTYVNGEKVGYATLKRVTPVSQGYGYYLNFGIAADSWAGSYTNFVGGIGAVRYYNRVLNDSEIAQKFAAERLEYGV